MRPCSLSFSAGPVSKLQIFFPIDSYGRVKYKAYSSISLLYGLDATKLYVVTPHLPTYHTDKNGLQPTGPIETTKCDYESIESVNQDLFNNLNELVKTPFFKYFQVS